MYMQINQLYTATITAATSPPASGGQEADTAKLQVTVEDGLGAAVMLAAASCPSEV
jgi:hypothetical protein